MKETSIFLDFLGDSPMTRILDYLVTWHGVDYCISDLADNAHVGRATLYRIWDQLVKNKTLVYTRTIGKSKLYKLNTDLPAIRKLIELDNTLLHEELKRKGKEFDAQKIKAKSSRKK